jgi:3-hydroxyacyl-[acyl-carrier-protein] dehydratase
MILNIKNIEDFIPQRNPILLVDNLISIINNTATISYVVKESIFVVEKYYMSKYGLIEHVAQSSALYYGFLHGKSIGMIGMIKKLEINNNLFLGSKIITKITIIKEIGNLVSVNSESFLNNLSVMKCEMLLNFEKK